MTMLELLVSCDSSKACHGFYDDRLMLLRWHVKKGFIISKAKGWDSFLVIWGKRFQHINQGTPIVSGHEIVHFPSW
jgi:hypothetical protein